MTRALERLLSVLVLRHILKVDAGGRYAVETGDLADFYAASIEVHLPDSIAIRRMSKFAET